MPDDHSVISQNNSQPQSVQPLRINPINSKIVIPQPIPGQIRLPFPWIQMGQQSNHSHNYNYLPYELFITSYSIGHQRAQIPGYLQQPVSISQFQATAPQQFRQALPHMTQPSPRIIHNFQSFPDILNNTQYAQSNQSLLGYTHHSLESNSQYQNYHQIPIHAQNNHFEYQNTIPQLTLDIHQPLKQQLLNGCTSEFQKQSFSISSNNNNNDLQISEVLTRTRRKELENALNKAKSDDEAIIQSRLKRKQSKSSRGSQFRGVSKNGKKWQVQLLGNLKKHYIGSIGTEARAARIYDRHAILTHGLRAKTNFSYTKSQIQQILDKEKDELELDETVGSNKEQITNDEDYAPSMNMSQVTQELIKPENSNNRLQESEIVKSEEPTPKSYKNSNQLIF